MYQYSNNVKIMFLLILVFLLVFLLLVALPGKLLKVELYLIILRAES